MTLKEAAAYLGKPVSTREHGVSIYWTVVDWKLAWGSDRWLIEPVAGSGSRWVETETIAVREEDEIGVYEDGTAV
jgi:hypothetical protein